MRGSVIASAISRGKVVNGVDRFQKHHPGKSMEGIDCLENRRRAALPTSGGKTSDRFHGLNRYLAGLGTGEVVLSALWRLPGLPSQEAQMDLPSVREGVLILPMRARRNQGGGGQ